MEDEYFLKPGDFKVKMKLQSTVNAIFSIHP